MASGRSSRSRFQAEHHCLRWWEMRSSVLIAAAACFALTASAAAWNAAARSLVSPSASVALSSLGAPLSDGAAYTSATLSGARLSAEAECGTHPISGTLLSGEAARGLTTGTLVHSGKPRRKEVGIKGISQWAGQVLHSQQGVLHSNCPL